MDQTPSEEVTEDTITDQPEINEDVTTDMTDDEFEDFVNGLLNQ